MKKLEIWHGKFYDKYEVAKLILTYNLIFRHEQSEYRLVSKKPCHKFAYNQIAILDENRNMIQMTDYFIEMQKKVDKMLDANTIDELVIKTGELL